MAQYPITTTLSSYLTDDPIKPQKRGSSALQSSGRMTESEMKVISQEDNSLKGGNVSHSVKDLMC